MPESLLDRLYWLVSRSTLRQSTDTAKVTPTSVSAEDRKIVSAQDREIVYAQAMKIADKEGYFQKPIVTNQKGKLKFEIPDDEDAARYFVALAKDNPSASMKIAKGDKKDPILTLEHGRCVPSKNCPPGLAAEIYKINLGDVQAQRQELKSKMAESEATLSVLRSEVQAFEDNMGRFDQMTSEEQLQAYEKHVCGDGGARAVSAENHELAEKIHQENVSIQEAKALLENPGSASPEKISEAKLEIEQGEKLISMYTRKTQTNEAKLEQIEAFQAKQAAIPALLAQNVALESENEALKASIAENEGKLAALDPNDDLNSVEIYNLKSEIDTSKRAIESNEATIAKHEKDIAAPKQMFQQAYDTQKHTLATAEHAHGKLVQQDKVLSQEDAWLSNQINPGKEKHALSAGKLHQQPSSATGGKTAGKGVQAAMQRYDDTVAARQTPPAAGAEPSQRDEPSPRKNRSG